MQPEDNSQIPSKPTLPQLPDSPYAPPGQAQAPQQPAENQNPPQPPAPTQTPAPAPLPPLPAQQTPPQPLVQPSQQQNPYDAYEPRSPRRLNLIPLIALLLFVAVALGGWFLFQSLRSDTKQQTLSTEGVNYSFDFDPSGKRVTQNGQDYIQGKELHGATTILVGIKKSPVEGDCTTRGARAEFNVQMPQGTFPVCSPDKKVFVTYFKQDNAWHIVTIFPEDRRTAPQQQSIKDVLVSLSVK